MDWIRDLTIRPAKDTAKSLRNNLLIHLSQDLLKIYTLYIPADYTTELRRHKGKR